MRFSQYILMNSIGKNDDHGRNSAEIRCFGHWFESTESAKFIQCTKFDHSRCVRFEYFRNGYLPLLCGQQFEWVHAGCIYFFGNNHCHGYVHSLFRANEKIIRILRSSRWSHWRKWVEKRVILNEYTIRVCAYLGGQNEASKGIYDDLYQRLAKRNKSIEFYMAKLYPAIIVSAKSTICFLTYFTNGMKNDAFELLYPMWWAY